MKMIDVNKMTLSQCWRECLRMWKWIAEQEKEGNPNSVYLKYQWLDEQGYNENYDIVADCFFCTYDNLHLTQDNCENCPGKIIQRSLEAFWCEMPSWDYRTKPIKFYKKLVRLNARRLSKKK